MASRLILDFGNTALKAAVFSDNAVSRQTVIGTADAKTIFSFCGSDRISAAIIGSVIAYPASLVQDLRKFFPVIELNSSTSLPVNNNYESKETLGYDRIAAAVGAWQLFPGSPVLAIVAGTCITYNIVDAKGNFCGGAISPGFHMRLRAMHEYTQRLPLIPLEGPHPLTGNSTETSLRAGALHATIAEAKEMIRQYAEAYPGLKTAISGGDGTILADGLKNGIFARPNLVMEGLNRILEHHAENNLL